MNDTCEKVQYKMTVMIEKIKKIMNEENYDDVRSLKKNVKHEERTTRKKCKGVIGEPHSKNNRKVTKTHGKNSKIKKKLQWYHKLRLDKITKAL